MSERSSNKLKRDEAEPDRPGSYSFRGHQVGRRTVELRVNTGEFAVVDDVNGSDAENVDTEVVDAYELDKLREAQAKAGEDEREKKKEEVAQRIAIVTQTRQDIPRRVERVGLLTSMLRALGIPRENKDSSED